MEGFQPLSFVRTHSFYQGAAGNLSLLLSHLTFWFITGRGICTEKPSSWFSRWQCCDNIAKKEVPDAPLQILRGWFSPFPRVGFKNGIDENDHSSLGTFTADVVH